MRSNTNIKLGKIYSDECEIRINNGRAVIYKGVYLKTVEDTPNQKDIHYFRAITYIPKNEKVEVVGYWFNFYGRYVRVKYNNDIFDVDPSSLTII